MQGFCPLKIKITQFPGGFCLKSILLGEVPTTMYSQNNSDTQGQAVASVLSLYGVRIKRAFRKKNVTEICFIDIKTKKTFLTKKRCLIS